MMNSAQAGPSSWQNVIRLRLEERDARERSYDDMIENYQRMARLAKQHRDRSANVLAAAGIGKTASNADGGDTSSTKARAVPGTSIESDAVRAAYISSLETQLSSVRDELSTHLRNHAQSTQKLRTIEEQMRERDVKSKDMDDELGKLREELSRMRRRDDDYKDNIRAKDKAIEMLQDEMATLTLELSQLEARLEESKRDNASLLQRWLDRMNQEAERMNDGNLFLQDVDRRRAASGQADGQRESGEATTPPRSAVGDLSNHATPKGKAT